MRCLVVNADDFGAGRGVNRGIVEAHRRGIVTSTSLMTEGPASAEAARLAGECPSLRLLPRFEELASRCGVPLRDRSGVRYCSRFYGQWDGESHPEAVSAEALIRVEQAGIVLVGSAELRPPIGLTNSGVR